MGRASIRSTHLEKANTSAAASPALTQLDATVVVSAAAAAANEKCDGSKSEDIDVAFLLLCCENVNSFQITVTFCQLHRLVHGMLHGDMLSRRCRYPAFISCRATYLRFVSAWVVLNFGNLSFVVLWTCET